MTDKADSGRFQRTPPESPLENPPGNPPASPEGNDARNRQAPNPAPYPAPGGPGQDQPGRGYLDGFLFERPGGRDGPAGKEVKEGLPDGAAEGSLEGSLEDRVVEALRAIYDPEIPVNIYDLGLIYGVAVDADAHVVVTMTLTTPHCPVAEIMPAEVEQKTSAVPGVSGATVNLVWDPPWDPSCMSEEAQLELGFI